ncbi:MAG: 1-phosphofructokinase [Armatimonadota bacterium]|nr:1-phosphofructokinase [Armatimonadota bacterium]
MILSITLNPCVDRTIFVDGLNVHDSNRVLRCETDAGGKGVNAARIIGELGVPVVATGFLGGGTGDYIWRVLDDEKVDPDFIVVPGETRLNISVEDGSGTPPTTFNEKGPCVSERDLEGLSGIIFRHMAGCKYVTAGGSLPPGIPDDAYAKLVEFTRSHGVSMAVDADGEALRQALEARPFLVKPNADEAGRLLGDEPQSLEDGVRAAQRMRELGAEVAIVSMGAMGAALAADGVALIAEPPQVEAASTIGAGDSLIGGFLVGLTRGVPIRDALALGVAAGAATASTSGSEIGRRPVIERLLNGVIIRDA